MKTEIDTITEYAVEVPGRGYIGFGGRIMHRANDYTMIREHSAAESSLTSARQQYTSMGCPEIAETCRIVVRKLTITASGWYPANFPGSTGAEENTTADNEKEREQ